jgi:hypothetical protein
VIAGPGVKWYVKHPFSIPDPPIPADQDSGAELRFDDDYWRDQRYRAPKLVGFLPIEELEKKLRADASAEYQQRVRAEPKERREARLEHERQVRELVLRANETDDPGLWQEVDSIVFDQTATEAGALSSLPAGL